MKWPWASRGEAVRPEPEKPSAHHSLALKPLLDALHPEVRSSVLDLGPPVGPNLELFSRLSCRVRIADFYRSLLTEPVSLRAPEHFPALMPRLLPFKEGERFDLALAWDLLDYLRKDQIATLIAYLAPACNPRALLLALVSNRPQIPSGPLRYRILDRQSLAYEGNATPARPCPRHAQPELVRLMGGHFRVHSSFLLRHGIQEYLFVRVG